MSLKKISKGNQQREKEIQEELYQCINQKESIIFNSGAGSTNRNDSSQLNCSAERAGCHDRTWCISGTDKTDRAFYHKNRICGNGCSSGSNPDADDCGIIAVPVQFSGCTSGNSDLCIRTDWNQCGDFCTVKWYGLHRSSEEYLL